MFTKDPVLSTISIDNQAILLTGLFLRPSNLPKMIKIRRVYVAIKFQLRRCHIFLCGHSEGFQYPAVGRVDGRGVKSTKLIPKQERYNHYDKSVVIDGMKSSGGRHYRGRVEHGAEAFLVNMNEQSYRPKETQKTMRM